MSTFLVQFKCSVDNMFPRNNILLRAVLRERQ